MMVMYVQSAQIFRKMFTQVFVPIFKIHILIFYLKQQERSRRRWRLTLSHGQIFAFCTFNFFAFSVKSSVKKNIVAISFHTKL